MKRENKNRIIFYSILSVVLIIITSIFVYKYVINESPVYIFDYSGYHETYKQYSKDLINSPRNFIRGVISSIRNSDYNGSPILLIIPFYAIFKGTRIGYILGLCIMYVVPTMILMYALLKRMLNMNKENNKKEGKDNKIFLVFTIFYIFLYTRWWASTLRGLPDIVALVPLTIAGILYFRNSFIEKRKVYIPIIIGFLLYLCFMFRRYFVYEIIGFYFSMFVIELINFFHKKENKKEYFFNEFKNFLLSGCTTLLCVFAIQTPLIMKILGENYSNAYSAFQVPILNHITNAVNEFGYIIIIFAFVGIIYTMINKEHRLKGLFCIINILVCYITFMTVQAMGVHHYLTISIWIFILFIYGIYGIWKFIKLNWMKVTFLIIILILMMTNFVTTFIMRNVKIPIISQNNKYCKFYYENFDGIENLVKDLDSTLKDKNARFSVLASSETLSDNLLDLLGTEKMKSSIVYTSAVDLRDGINFNSLMSEYIVVTDIAQTGVSVEGQRIVSVPNDAIINGTSIGKAYKLLSGPYTMEHGVKAYIYEKTRSFTEDETIEYMNTLIQYHPEWKEKYNYLYYAILMSKRELGDNIGEAKMIDEDTLYFSPGNNPTKFILKTNKKIEELKLKPYIKDNSREEKGKVIFKINENGNTIYEKEITNQSNEEIELNLGDVTDLEFIIDKDEYLDCDWLYIDVLGCKIK